MLASPGTVSLVVATKNGHRLWRRTLLQGGGFVGLPLGFGDVDSSPSALSRKCLSLSEKFGVGTDAASDLNNGVTWIGELNSTSVFS